MTITSRVSGIPGPPTGGLPELAAPVGCAISPELLRDWLARGEATVIDVREPMEFAREHIEGAVLLPLSQFDPAAIKAQARDVVVLHCQSGQRSSRAAVLARMGGCEVVELEGGLDAWKRAGLPTAVNPHAPLPIMRQVQIAAGSLVVVGVALGSFVSPWFLVLSGFVGCGLVFAGLSGRCGLAMALGRMPWNQVKVKILERPGE